MKFSAVVSFMLLGAAIAAPATPVKREPTLVERDYATVSSVIADVQAKTITLDNQIKAFTGTQAQVTQVQAASDAVLKAINDGEAKIKAGTSLTLSQAYQVASQVDGLIKVVNTTVDDAIAKKATAVQAQAGGKVYKAFTDQKAAAQKLGDTIATKVPAAAQNLAKDKTKQITDALQRGITAYADQAGTK